MVDITYPRRVLVADAHGLERLGVVEVLRLAYGCEQCDLAVRFSEVARTIREDTSLVVLDESLPELVTFEMLRELRHAHPTVRFVIVSTSCDPNSVFAALMAGMNGFIPKTLSTDEMVDAFRFVASGHVFVPPDLAEVQVPSSQASLQKGWSRIMKLSSRQRQVLQLACEGSSNKEIARKLSISEATVKVHVGAAFRVIGVTNRIHAAALFHQHRLLLEDGEASDKGRLPEAVPEPSPAPTRQRS